MGLIFWYWTSPSYIVVSNIFQESINDTEIFPRVLSYLSPALIFLSRMNNDEKTLGFCKFSNSLFSEKDSTKKNKGIILKNLKLK